jgi:hypothetical protein
MTFKEIIETNNKTMIQKKFNELAILMFEEDEKNKKFEYGKDFESCWRMFISEELQDNEELKSSVFQIWRMKHIAKDSLFA